MKRAAVILITGTVPVRKGTFHLQFLLACTNRRFGGYALPGGKCEGDEEPRETAIRELKEETNLIAHPATLTWLCASVNVIEDEECEVTVFHAREVFGHLANLERGTEHKWMGYTEFLNSTRFSDFYRRHFPDGVHHFRNTKFSK